MKDLERLLEINELARIKLGSIKKLDREINELKIQAENISKKIKTK